MVKHGSASIPFFKNDWVEIYQSDMLNVDIAKSSIDLIVTSPPYNVDIQYASSNDVLSYKNYLAFSKDWIAQCYEWARDDCRFCMNIPLDKNKNGHNSVYADLVTLAKQVGWQYFTSIVWNEGNISRRTAWGSWQSASAPHVIAPVEMIAILYKEQWKKDRKGQSDISRDDFINWTNGLWTFNGESKKRVGHPAPFPIELPKRCIQLLSYIGDTVLDPFLGSGTTLIASSLLGRKGIGIDIDKTYCELAVSRIQQSRGALF